jgi:hypothetical protein
MTPAVRGPKAPAVEAVEAAEALTGVEAFAEFEPALSLIAVDACPPPTGVEDLAELLPPDRRPATGSKVAADDEPAGGTLAQATVRAAEMPHSFIQLSPPRHLEDFGMTR